MAYRLIYSEFWTDPKVIEDMNQEDKFFYLYILTNPKTTNCGIYMITKKQMAFDLGTSLEAVNSLMDRFEKQHNLIIYNPDTRELAIRNWGRYNLSRGGKPVMDCLSAELSRVKDKSLIKYVQNNIKNPVIFDLFEGFCGTSTKGQREVSPQGDNTDTSTITNTITDTETDTNTEYDTSFEKMENTQKEEAKLSHSLIQEYEKETGCKGILNPAAVKAAITQHGYSNVKMAIDKALEKGKFTMSYVNGILRTWEKEGYPKEDGGMSSGSVNKDNGASSNKFAGFKPKEPVGLTEEERRKLEASLI